MWRCIHTIIGSLEALRSRTSTKESKKSLSNFVGIQISKGTLSNCCFKHSNSGLLFANTNTYLSPSKGNEKWSSNTTALKNTKSMPRMPTANTIPIYTMVRSCIAPTEPSLPNRPECHSHQNVNISWPGWRATWSTEFHKAGGLLRTARMTWLGPPFDQTGTWRGAVWCGSNFAPHRNPRELNRTAPWTVPLNCTATCCTAAYRSATCLWWYTHILCVWHLKH